MAGALRALILPPPGLPDGPARAKLSSGREALGVAGASELRLLALPASTRLHGAPPAPLGASLPGAWEDFVWEVTEEEEEEEGLAVDRLRLLALARSHELFLYEVVLETGRCDVTLLQSCPEERLKGLIASENRSFPAVSSLKVLSFKSGRALLLLNNSIVAHLTFPGGAEEEKVDGCFALDLPPCALEKTVDVTFRRGVLFLLEETDIFGMADGAHLAHVSVSLYQAEGQEEGSTGPPSPLGLLNVSRDLRMAVVLSRTGCLAAIDLNVYFREYPDHLFCKRSFENLPVAPLEGSDEDDLRSSNYSMKFVQPAFRTDRSWKAHLLALNDAAKKAHHPHLLLDVELPWYQSLLHRELLDIRALEVSGTSLFGDGAPALSGSGGEDQQNLRSRRWETLPLGDLEDCVKLECKNVTSFSALFTAYSESEGLTLISWDLMTRDLTRSPVGRNSFFVEHTGQEPLWLTLSETGLSLLLFGVTQEDFLNRLIIYGHAGTVDAVCRLNRWGRCSIPVHALEAGLENRQLDTVDFFLKNKENLFSLPAACSVQDQPASIVSDFYLKSVEELRPALDLLCVAIQENDLEAQSKHFSEQLLNLTLSFLNKQLREMLMGREELDDKMARCVDIFTSYITRLRTFMMRFPHKSPGVVGLPCDSENDVPQMEQSQRWGQFDTEQTVTDALLSNQLPEAQTFFRLTSNPAQNLEELTRIGLEMVYKSLLKGDISEASELLRNMGVGVKQQLHKICFYTTDYHVRELLVKRLQEEKFLSRTEEEAIDFVRQLEQAYSGPFQEEERGTAGCRSWRREPRCDIAAALDDFLNCSEDRLLNGEHRAMFNWAQRWSPLTRERILLPLRSPEEWKACNPELLWTYLSSWNDGVNIGAWIAESQLQEGSQGWPPLPVEAIGERTSCGHFLRNEILDLLARNGTFVPAELRNFEGLLQRLAFAGGVMRDAHPLPGYVSAGGLDFHTCFILYCVERGLDHLLYTYLDSYRLSSSDCPVLADKGLHEAHPWFEFLVQCREIAGSPGDAKRILQASLANAQVLIPSSQASVSTMLLEGRTLLALATAMFTGGGIDQIVQNGDGREKVDVQLFRMALAPYPKLRAALFPQTPPHGLLPADISLYHLLQALLPFDSAKLFGWQSANSLAVPDVCSDLPHFSCPVLVSKYAVIEHLDFSYYLYQERPSFAFGVFLSQQLSKNNSPKEQLVRRGGSEAYGVALALFHLPSVTATCICFLELLGLSSLKLRVDLRAANVILSFMSRREEPQHNSIRQSLAEKLAELADGEAAAAGDLLVCLEEAVWDRVEHREIKKTSREARKLWGLVVQFCQLHNVKLSVSYLKACARENEWLQFVTEAQLHGYQPAEVTPLLQDFPRPLQGHLRLALERLHPPGVPPEGTAGPSNLCRVLLWSQTLPQPWQHLLVASVTHHAPVLSVLAACFQEASVIHCLCVWIITSLDGRTAGEVSGLLRGFTETQQGGLPELALLWRTLLERQKVRTLLRGLQFFLKDSPLLILLEAYELCMERRDYSKAKTNLLAFQARLSELQAKSGGSPPTLPGPWLVSQATFLLELMMQQCRTDYELRKLLQLITDAGTALPQGPGVGRLSALCNLLKDTSVSISRGLLSCYTPGAFQEECRRILEQLQEGGNFSVARDVAKLAELPVDNVVIQEALQSILLLKERARWPQKRTRLEFWKRCQENFVRSGISEEAASCFFSAQVGLVAESCEEEAEAEAAGERTSRFPERQLLLTLAGHWLAHRDPVPLDELEAIEKEVWLCRVARRTLGRGGGQSGHGAPHQLSAGGGLSFDSLAREFSFAKAAALNAAKYLELEEWPSQEVSRGCLSAADVASLDFLVGTLLEEGSLHEAARVCRYFSFPSRDASLALHCRMLASGVPPRCFRPEIRALLAARETEQSERAEPGRSSGGPGSCSPLGGSSPDGQVVSSLQALLAECKHGRSYCRRILCLYELSQELGCSFGEIAVRDSEQLLRAILSSQQPDRCRKAQAFISNQELEPETVAELVAEEILQELLAPPQGRGKQKERLNPAEESQMFLQLAKLCQDHTLVGTKLLDKISSVPHGDLASTTELLILAHHCFSLTCHMEGISRVLHAARLLTEDHLAPKEEFGLVVRLLTGIGRYNEMTYIFDLLHEKHYFEVLMRKKLDPNGSLKTALLDYLQRCRPGDSEKHNMVALCFSMCREIGENHEAAGNVQLKLIESQPWEESLQDVPGLKRLLMKALTLFLDAAESYSKDFCVRQSLRCNRLTKLITLQLHFLNSQSNVKLINLSRKSLLPCLLALPRFYQAAVVAEAYDFVPDWSEVLYQQVILKGDFNYLEEYKQCGLLKASTLEDIAQKFQQNAGGELARKNLKKLLTYCDDLYVHYKLAYEHQFYDVVNMLLNDAQTGCCLNDLLAN